MAQQGQAVTLCFTISPSKSLAHLRVYFKTQGITEAQGKEFVEHIKSGLKQVWTITSMHGKWDYALFLGVKTIAEFHEIWDDIMLSFKKILSLIMSLYTHRFIILIGSSFGARI